MEADGSAGNRWIEREFERYIKPFEAQIRPETRAVLRRAFMYGATTLFSVLFLEDGSRPENTSRLAEVHAELRKFADEQAKEAMARLTAAGAIAKARDS